MEKKKNRDVGYDFIRFFSTILILLWHFYTTLSENFDFFKNIKFSMDTKYISMGSVGVGLFFILSGSLLIKRYEDEIDVKEFYKKRIKRIYIPYWLIYIFFFLIMLLINKQVLNTKKIGIITSFFGLDFFDSILYAKYSINALWLAGEWFTTVILIMYLLFPLLRMLYKKNKIIYTLPLTLIFALNLKFHILTYGNGYFSISNAIFYFWIGMLLSSTEIKESKKIITASSIIGILVLIIKIKTMSNFGYIFCVIFSICSYIILYNIKLSNKFTKLVCRNNYEIYLTHHRIYYWLIPIFIGYNFAMWEVVLTFIIINLIVLILSDYFNKISNMIIKKEGILK